MANFSLFFPKLMGEEGGDKFTERSSDRGGPTKFGITLKTWIACGYDKDHNGIINAEDLKLITWQDAEAIAKPIYWDKVGGDIIPSQAVAEFSADWAYNSGAVTAVKHLQRILGLADDGIAGPQTLAAIKAAPQEPLFEKLKASRLQFVAAIVAGDPSQAPNLEGWNNRINSFKYAA